jgi:hypothetical protein
MSNCRKRYCECFRQGKFCDINCRCQQCGNQEPEPTEHFKINRLRITIAKNKIYINEEIGREDVFTEKKRERKVKLVELKENTPIKTKDYPEKQSTSYKTERKRKSRRYKSKQVKRKLLVN